MDGSLPRVDEALPEHPIQLVVVGRDQAHNPVERRGKFVDWLLSGIQFALRRRPESAACTPPSKRAASRLAARVAFVSLFFSCPPALGRRGLRAEKLAKTSFTSSSINCVCPRRVLQCGPDRHLTVQDGALHRPLQNALDTRVSRVVGAEPRVCTDSINTRLISSSMKSGWTAA